MEQDDDFGFVRNHLTRELAEELELFRYNARADGQVKVLEHRPAGLHESDPRAQVQLRRARCVAADARAQSTARSSCTHDHVP